MRHLLLTILFLLCSATAYCECTVGGVTLELDKYSNSYFSDIPTDGFVEDNIVFTVPFKIPRLDEKIKVVVNDNVNLPGETFSMSSDKSGTVYLSKEYTITYLAKDEKIAEYTGVFETNFGSGRLIRPYKGVLKFVCGEVWDLRIKDPASAKWRTVKRTPEGHAKYVISHAASENDDAKKKANEIAALKAFQKSVAVGSEVRISRANFVAVGTVVNTKGSKVQIQYAKRYNQMRWVEITAFKEWVSRSELRYP